MLMLTCMDFFRKNAPILLKNDDEADKNKLKSIDKNIDPVK